MHLVGFIIRICHGARSHERKTEHFIFANCSDVLCNKSFKEHLPEDGHNRWPKHIGNYAVYTRSTINLHVCICVCWFCGFVFHNSFVCFVHV